MNLKIVTNYIGRILCIEAAFMLPALMIALYKQEASCLYALAGTMLAMIALGIFASRVKTDNKAVYSKEGFVIVALSWIVISVFGACPFFFSGAIPNFLDALFETISGFTTTGASILTDVEAMPMSLLYWRSFTHWLGGMGVLVFMLAIMPAAKGNGSVIRLMRAESPGPEVGKLVPRLHHTARILYIIYVAMTALEIILLVCGGMPLFDSIVNSFGTAGTGGFAIKNASIGAYDSAYLQYVIAIFMAAFGVNFNVYYLVLIRDFKSVFKNGELRLYLGIMLGATAAIAINTRSMFDSIGEGIRGSFFQVSSIMTTTGFATVDFDKWPEFSRCLLLVLMVIGASAGSTGGGIKVARVQILLKSLRNSIQKYIHPRSVKLIKVDGAVVSSEVTQQVNVFMVVYIIITVLSVLVVSADDFSFDTTVSSVFACLNNIGPGLGAVGPTGNYHALSPLSKIVLSADMLFGRLEIFPMLLLFTPSMWRKGK